MAVAVMVKPQGILFPLLWVLIGARRAALGFLVAALVLVLAQAGFGTDWTPWRQFVDSLSRIPQSNDYFRNQSLYSVLRTALRTIGLEGDRTILLMVVRGSYAVIAGWFVYRFIEREKRFRAIAGKVETVARARFDLVTRVGSHTVDMVLLALLCSPLVWTHHYAIALPALLWVLALTRGRPPRAAIVALVLMFVPSTFDVWFFSYHRLVGVVLLAVTMSPARTFTLYLDSAKRAFPALTGAAETGA
jgi:hypothetical protein